MSNVFGVVNKPLFDTDVFKSGQPIHVIDYDKGVEYSSIIVEVTPMYLDILSYDKVGDSAKFNRITVDQFIEGLYELKALVIVELEDANRVHIDRNSDIIEIIGAPEELEVENADVVSDKMTVSYSFLSEEIEEGEDKEEKDNSYCQSKELDE